MFSNYFKSALRFIRQNKVFSGINALGLSIALAASFTILLYVINELSYDTFHKNSKRIYRVLNYYKDFNVTLSGTPYVLATALKEEFPQVEKSIRQKYVRGFRLKLRNEFIDVPTTMGTDSDVFDIFTLPLIMGSSQQNLLEDQNSIVLSRDLAQKFFPGQNPIGKEMEGIVNNEEHIFIVRAVFENIPANSTLRTECLINSRWTLDPINKTLNINNADKDWTQDFWSTWVLLSKEANARLIEDQFQAFEIKNISEKPNNHYSLQNLSDVYLGSEHVENSGIRGNINNVKLFSAIALIIILVAAFNYIILSTAVSTSRAKEIGIRKTFGAGNNNIKNQLLSESVLMAVIILPVALLLMWLALPNAGRLFQTELKIISSNIIIYISVYLVVTIFIGIASGIYTSGYLSRLKVLEILKNNTLSGRRKPYFRSSLIVIQLIIFCTFVECTFIIRAQYQYAINKDPGYYNHDVLLVNLGRNFKGYSSYINNIKSNPNVILAAGAMEGLPMQGYNAFMFPSPDDKEKKIKVEGLAVDYNFLTTMGVSFIEGRDFSQEFGSDLNQSIILNETAVKKIGITDPIGKNIIEDKTIIGVVKDFNLHSIHSGIEPLDITMTDKYIDQVAIHYKPGTLNAILPMLESEWKKAAPGRPFNYTTIEDLIKSLYSSEKNLTIIVSIFALFTLIIATLGLFGLTLFVARSRTKEIGIKKIFGCRDKSIIYSFIHGNLILVLLAAFISVPVTLHFMMKWLKNFSFKAVISWHAFVIAFVIAAVVVLLTVFVHSYRASRINPVDALRYE
jgi:putative ABC transport system permease protein